MLGYDDDDDDDEGDFVFYVIFMKSIKLNTFILYLFSHVFSKKLLI